MAKKGMITVTINVIPAAGKPAKPKTVEVAATGVSFTEALKAAGLKPQKGFQYELNGAPVREDKFDTTHVKAGDSVNAAKINVTEKARGS